MPDQPVEDATHTYQNLTQEDLYTLQLVKNNIDWLRAVACTLGRRGVAFREEGPERACEILEVFAPHPFYRAGQFLFDLLEMEDFMFDGPPPPVLNTVMDTHTINHLISLLKTFRSYLDSGQYKAGSPEQFRQIMHEDVENLVVDDRDLPALQHSFYLYQDVVLGLYHSILGFVPQEPEPEPEPRPEPGKHYCVDFNGLKEGQVDIDSVIYRRLNEEQVVRESMKYQWLTFRPLGDPLRFMELGDPPDMIKLSIPSSGVRIEFPMPMTQVTVSVNNYGGQRLKFAAYNKKDQLEEFTLHVKEVVKLVEFTPRLETETGIQAIQITGGGESSLIEVCYWVP